MKANRLPPFFDLVYWLKYKPETGDLIWRYSPNPKVPAGSIAGYHHPSGYIRIGWDGKHYPAHRIIFKLLHGDDPPEFIDHIDGNRSNNKLDNLRAVPKSVNALNQCARNRKTPGATGVYWRNGKWAVQITVGGKYHYLGKHETLLDAVCARKTAEQNHGFHSNHGKVIN